jgi:predicted deacylase
VQLEEHAVALLVDGARNALRHLGVLDGVPGPPRSRTVRDFVWLRSKQAGFWVASVTPGTEIREGGVLGEVRDLYGDVLETVRAPKQGVVLFLTTSAAVPADGLLLGLGAELD